jgi:hypothetical protein
LSTLQLLGAGGFGLLIGWYVYYVNRYRSGEVRLNDIVTVLGVVGGAGVLALFPAGTDLFGAYGIGLVVGFFGYLLVLAILLACSNHYDFDFLLDGLPKGADRIAAKLVPQRPMGEQPEPPKPIRN